MAGVDASQGTESVPVPMVGADASQGTEFEPVPMVGVDASQGTESVPVPMVGVDASQGTESVPVPMVGVDASQGTATDDRLKKTPQIQGMTSMQIISEVNSHTYVKPTDLKKLSAAKRETGKVSRFGNLVLQHTCKTVVPRPFRREERTAEQRLQEEGSWGKPFDEMPRTPQQWMDIKNRWAEMRNKQQARGKFFLSGPQNLEELFQTWFSNLDIVPSTMHQTTDPVPVKFQFGEMTVDQFFETDKNYKDQKQAISHLLLVRYPSFLEELRKELRSDPGFIIGHRTTKKLLQNLMNPNTYYAAFTPSQIQIIVNFVCSRLGVKLPSTGGRARLLSNISSFFGGNGVLQKRFWGKDNRVPCLKSSAAEVVKSQSYTVFENIEPELVYSRTSVIETMETDSNSLQALFEQRSSVAMAEHISLDMKPGSFIIYPFILVFFPFMGRVLIFALLRTNVK